MLRLNYVRDYSEMGCGKTFIFKVDDNKSISIDTEKDNAITAIWFHDKREDNSVVDWFSCNALVYMEDIISDHELTIDLDKLALYDEWFIDNGVEVC